MTAAAVVLPLLDGQQAQAWDTLMAVADDLVAQVRDERARAAAAALDLLAPPNSS